MNGILILLIWLILSGSPTDSCIPNKDKNNYRAALYSTQLDFSKAQRIVPEIQYAIPGLSSVSYKYIIQYGSDTIIEIIDPGNDIKAFTGCIRMYDYPKRQSTFTCYMDYGRTYYTTKDSILYAIDEDKGFITDLCQGVELNLRCDSVLFTLQSANTSCTIICNDTIANLRSSFLFYPDIKYLPNKIIGVGAGKNTLTLEEVIYGKAAVDSILQLYDYKGYEQITDEDISPADLQFTKDLLEKLKSTKY